MDLRNRLNELMRQASNEATLSPDALSELYIIAEESTTLLQEIQTRVTNAEELQIEVNNLNGKLSEALLDLMGVADRELKVAAREIKQDVLENSIKFEQLRVQDHKDMVGLIFRNTEIRRERFGSVPVEVNGFVTCHPTSESETEIKT